MTSSAFQSALARQAALAHAAVSDAQLHQLEQYYELLDRWNQRINLTALTLGAFPPEESLNRLFIEPLIASELIDTSPQTVVDLGSGAGSPALPLRIAKPLIQLTLVEARSRKAAFLREVVRTLGLNDVTVAAGRFQDFATSANAKADLVSARAVRADAEFLAAVDAILKPTGRLMMFAPETAVPRFTIIQRRALSGGSFVALYERTAG